MVKHHRFILAVLLVSMMFFVFGDGDNGIGPKEHMIVVGKDDGPGDIQVETTEKRAIIRRVEEALKDAPDSPKVRVVLRSKFSNHPSHYGMNAYPYAVVALNGKGEPDGIERFYSIGAGGGRLLRTSPWQDGKKHGDEKIYVNGTLKTVIPWDKGRIEGVRKTLFPNGKIQVTTEYRDGKPHGTQKTYSEDGKLLRLAHLKDGDRDGEVIEYWPGAETVRRRIHYKDGKVHGVTKDYYADGKLKRELPFANDSLQGVEQHYDPDGTITKTRYWSQGNPVPEREYRRATEK